jgi:glycosyltransferase involved in cell wall biosynthesis
MTEPIQNGAGKAPLRVLVLTTHPIEGAGSRYRVLQYIPYLERLRCQVESDTFFDSDAFKILYTPGDWAAKATAIARGTLRRAAVLMRANQYDVVLNYLWLHPVTFPVYDWLLRSVKTPVVYDLDDPYYLPSGSRADLLRDREWTVRLMRRAHTVIAGSEPIQDFARRHNPRVELIPTVIDTERFRPRDFKSERNPRPVIGWVGSHSTARFLEPLLPVFQSLARDHDFVLRIVGAGKTISIPGVNVECEPWMLAREVDHFRQLDIGLYPLDASGQFAGTKLGFKLHQYMAVGIPAIASTFGLNRGLVRHGEDSFLASDPEEWRTTLSLLLRDEALRHRIGAAGREHVVQNYSLASAAERMVSILRASAASRTRPHASSMAA